jgi:hypothetical protein
MREILDGVDPEDLRPLYADVFRELQRGKALEPFEFYAGCYLLSLDGTGYFSSQKIHCSSCQEKVNKQTGEVTYEHQMLGAAIVHPDPEAGRQHEERLRTECSPPIASEDPPAASSFETDRDRGWPFQQWSPCSGLNRP